MDIYTGLEKLSNTTLSFVPQFSIKIYSLRPLLNPERIANLELSLTKMGQFNTKTVVWTGRLSALSTSTYVQKWLDYWSDKPVGDAYV